MRDRRVRLDREIRRLGVLPELLSPHAPHPRWFPRLQLKEFRGVTRHRIVRLLPNGALDSVLTNAFDARQIAWRRVPAIALDGQGHLLASGVFRLSEAPEVENCAWFIVGGESVGLMLRADPDQAQLSAQVHPERRLTLESAHDAAGPWTSLATTNPVMSGIWSVRVAEESSVGGFFRLR